MDKPLAFAIADNHKLYRDGMKAGLKKYPQLKMIWEVQSTKELLNKLKHETPDILYLDLNLPHGDAIKTLQLLHQDYVDMKVIVLSNGNEEPNTNQIMAQGANALLQKSVEASEMYQAAMACLKEDFYFNELVSSALLSKLNQTKETGKFGLKKVSFNEKEVSIIKWLSEDKTSEEIAELTFSSLRTIENLRQSMKKKAGVKTVTGLLMYAVRNKMLD